jgi:hypothetical protein
MMNQRFNNPFGNNQMGDYYKALYKNNKALIWIALASLVVIMAVGSGFFHAFFIAYLIFMGGILYRQYFPAEKMYYTLTLGMLSGLLVYLAFFSSAITAAQGVPAVLGAAAFALLSAIATYAPNSQIRLALFGSVKLKWIVLILIGLDLLTVNPTQPTPRISHLGGVLFGFLSIYFSSKSSFKGFSSWFRFRKPGPYYKRPKKQPKAKRNYQRSTASQENDEEYNARKKQEQKEIDAILDKIKYSGYDSLSSEEKKRLFDQSRK